MTAFRGFNDRWYNAQAFNARAVKISATAGGATAGASAPTLRITVSPTAGNATASTTSPTVTTGTETPAAPIGLSTVHVGPPRRRVHIKAQPGTGHAPYTFPQIVITPEDEDLIFAAAGVLELV